MMELLWNRYPEGCKFGGIPPPFSLGPTVGKLILFPPEHPEREPIYPGGPPVIGRLIPKPRRPYVYVDGLGEPDGYVVKSTEVGDVKSRRVSLDLANAEESPAGIEQFVKTWGKPRLFLYEAEFYDMRKVIRSAFEPQCPSTAAALRQHRGLMLEPQDVFEFAVRETCTLIEHGAQVRACSWCERYYIAHKNAANRGGGQMPQRFCSHCGSSVRSKSRRLSMKLAGAQGRTGARVSADPRHAKPSTGRTR